MARSRGTRSVGKNGPDPVDLHVGKRIKLRRTMMRVSQDQLANDCGVTFQQVQKYESGHNRVSASRLFDISKVLGCPVSYFFQDLEETEAKRDTPSPRAPEAMGSEEFGDPMQRTESIEVVRDYWKIRNTDARKHFRGLLKAISHRVDGSLEAQA